MPFEGEMGSPITVAAWSHTMELDQVETDSITQFIEEFRAGGDAPEPNQECPPQEPEPFDPSAGGTRSTVTPGATPPGTPQPAPSKS